MSAAAWGWLGRALRALVFASPLACGPAPEDDDNDRAGEGPGVEEPSAAAAVEGPPPPAEPFAVDGEAEDATQLTFSFARRQWEAAPIRMVLAREPFAEGTMRVAYRLLNLSHPSGAQACVGKAIKEGPRASRQAYYLDIEMQAQCQAIADAFNACGPPKAVQFVPAFLIHRHATDLGPLQLLSVEPYLSGEYVKYNNNWGFVSDDERNTPQAFSHFSHHHTAGHLIIVDIQGVGDLYTDPQIHTRDQEGFGTGNCGPQGIAAFFNTHSCNSLCQFLGLPKYHHGPRKFSGTQVAALLPRPLPMADGPVATARDLVAPRLSVVVPVLNEADAIAATLRALVDNATTTDRLEVLVVDGGSDDGTLEQVAAVAAERPRGVPIFALQSARGRAAQQSCGAAHATGQILLFLHADTLPPPGFDDAARERLQARPAVAVGAFAFALSTPPEALPWYQRLSLCLIAWGANRRSRVRQLPYGDQALFLRRSAFLRMGGFRPLPLLEDLELVDRVRRYGGFPHADRCLATVPTLPRGVRRVWTLPSAARTSARRWLARGVWRTTLLNQLILLGWALGLAPATLAAWYRDPPWRLW